MAEYQGQTFENWMEQMMHYVAYEAVLDQGLVWVKNFEDTWF